jgi:hypothetical protein
VNRNGLLETFADFPGRLAEAVSTHNGAPVPAGEWSHADVVRHLIAVEREVWHARLAQIAVEDGPHWTWIEPGLAPGFDGLPLGDVVRAFAGVRAETVATVRALDDAGWARYGTHATYGVLDVAGLLRVAVEHDGDHLLGIDPAA